MGMRKKNLHVNIVFLHEQMDLMYVNPRMIFYY